MKKLRIGVRGHDVPAENADSLCSQLCALGVDEIQLVVHKSFPQFIYILMCFCRLKNSSRRPFCK
jgi:hypothetical protein